MTTFSKIHIKPHKYFVILSAVFILYLTLSSKLEVHKAFEIFESENGNLDIIQYTKDNEHKANESFKVINNILNTIQYTSNRIILSGAASAVWAFDAPLPTRLLEILNSKLERNLKKLKIFCYNAKQCKESIYKLRLKSFSIEIIQLKAFELSRNTPVVSWVASHPINKIKSLTCFPAYFQKIMYLSILWKYGGITIDLALKVPENATNQNLKITSTYEGCMLDQRNISALICNLQPNDKYTKYLMREIVKLFKENPMSCAFDSNFPGEIGYIVPSANIKFGLLEYGYTKNLGDNMQSIAATHILPHVYTFINRETFNNSDRISLSYIGNAYWDKNGILFNDIPNLVTVPVAFHISPDAYTKINSSKSLLTAMAPIGTRDLTTLDILRKNGIESFFTGCLTLWMKNPSKLINSTRTNETIIVDPRWIHNPVPKERTNIKYMTHRWDGKVKNNYLEDKFNTIYEYLMQYAHAKVVVTSRLHVALPCVAMGTPVVFIKKVQNSRYPGLLDLFHTVDMYTMGEENALEFFNTFNWESPPPNPNSMKVEVLKKEATKILEQIPELAVSLKVFELI